MSHYKPYPAYKDSGVEWLGEVPEHWTEGPLKVLLQIENGADYKEVEADTGYPVIGSGGAFAFASQKMYDGESVLLGRKGTIDRPLYINGPFWTVDTMYWSIIKPGFYGRFAYYVATTIPFDMYSTNTALPSMTKSVLGAHQIIFPDLTEQKTIADHLDRETNRIDSLIAKKTRFIELLKEKRQALIKQAVTKGLDPNVKMKDSGVEWLGEVPEHWSVQAIKLIAFVGNGCTPNRENKKYWENGSYPWLTSALVNLNEVRQAEEFVTQVALDECSLPKIPPPAVLIGLTGQGRTRGMATTLYIEATISQHIACIKQIEKNIEIEYLRSVMDSGYFFLRDESDGGGSTKGAVTCDQIKSLKIPVPPIDEQKAIAEFIRENTEKIISVTEKTERSITLLKERRSALITAAVTGQIDLREAA